MTMERKSVKPFLPMLPGAERVRVPYGTEVVILRDDEGEYHFKADIPYSTVGRTECRKVGLTYVMCELLSTRTECVACAEIVAARLTS